MDEFIIELDTRIFMWVNSRHTEFWDMFMFLISGRAIWIPFYSIMLYTIWLCYGWRTTLLMVLMTGVAIAACDQICSEFIRPAVERMRPTNPDNPLSEYVHIVDDYRGGRFGFPSCHAANAFTLATLTSLLFRQWRYTLFIFLWGALICYSRIYLGVHYPGDILAGLTIGCIFGAAAYALAGTALGLFIYFYPKARESRAIVTRYKRGAPMRSLTIAGHTLRWRATDITIAAGLFTFVTALVIS